MPSSKGERQFGDKLIPKLQSAIVEAVIGSKRGLLDTEHTLKVTAAKAIADIIGEELAELTQPLTDKVLDEANLPDEIKEIVRKMASGENQFQAIAGWAVGATGVTGLLSSVMNNAFAPELRRILSAAPQLDVPWQMIAAMVVRGLQSQSLAYGQIGGQGINENWLAPIYQLNQAIPDVATLLEWMRRGLMSEQEAEGWLLRNALPTDLNQLYIDLVRTYLSPSDMALAVLRGDTTQQYAEQIANVAGLTDNDFNILLLNTGEPPGPEQLMEAFRRGIINQETFDLGIRQSRIRDQWLPVMEALRYSPLSVADAIEAAVKGYITQEQAQSYAAQNGLNPDDFETAYESAGEPLSRTEMTDLWRRGYVTEQDVAAAIQQSRVKDSYVQWALLLKDAPMSTADAIEAYVQGYLTQQQATQIAQMNGLREQDIDPLMLTAGEPLPKEEMLKLWNRGAVTQEQVEDALRQSRLKDSYINTALELAVQLPALYEVRTLLADGSLTAAQATTLLLEQGYQADIVKSIVAGASGQTLAATKTLTAAQLSTLYQEQELSAAEYVDELVALGYSQAEAELYETMEAQKWSITARNHVITKIRSQYTGHKITAQQASAQLDALQVSAAMRDQLLEFWNLELESAVKLLSEAQIVDLWQLGLMEPKDTAANTQLALTYLENLGYSNTDAIRLLELKVKGPLGSQSQKPAASTGKSKGQTSTTGGANG